MQHELHFGTSRCGRDIFCARQSLLGGLWSWNCSLAERVLVLCLLLFEIPNRPDLGEFCTAAAPSHQQVGVIMMQGVTWRVDTCTIVCCCLHIFQIHPPTLPVQSLETSQTMYATPVPKRLKPVTPDGVPGF